MQDALYILASGRARAVQQGDDGEEVPLHVLEPGDAFGERGLLAEGPRTATVRASSEVDSAATRPVDLPGPRPQLPGHPRVVRAPRPSDGPRELPPALLRLRVAPSEALALMLRELRTIEVRKGEAVVREGQPPGSMYIVEDGKLRAYKKIGRRNTRRRVPPQGRLLRRGLDAEARATRGDGRSRHGRPAARARREDVHEAAEDRPGVPGADPSARRAVRLPDDGERPARLRGGDPPGGGERARVRDDEARVRGSSRSRTNSRRRSTRARSPSRRGASAASRSCTSSTRWTAAPRASRWSRATSDVPSTSATSARRSASAPTARACSASPRGPSRSAWPRARSKRRRAVWTTCRSPPSRTSTATTGSSSTTSTGAACASPIPRSASGA